MKVSFECWKELMTIKLDEDYSSVDVVIKDLLKLKKGKLKNAKK